MQELRSLTADANNLVLVFENVTRRLRLASQQFYPFVERAQDERPNRKSNAVS